MALMSENEMRDLCRRFLQSQHQRNGILVELNSEDAARWIRGRGWDEQHVRQILNEAMSVIEGIAAKIVTEFKERSKGAGSP